MSASLGIRLAGTNSDPRPRKRRSNEFRFCARRRARLLMTNWCLATRIPPRLHDSARAHEFGDGGQQVDGENEQVNHRYGRYHGVGSSQDCPHRSVCARIYEFAMDREKIQRISPIWDHKGEDGPNLMRKFSGLEPN